MLAYSGGTDVGAIVAEVGHYTTKMGFAGEDYPRALFRSQVAVQRDSSNKIHKLRHDYMHHPLDVKSGTDGDWETANPIDPSTGLVYYSSNANPSAEDAPSGGSSSKSGDDDCFELWMSQLRHGYETGLMGSNVKDHPLLLVEQPTTPAPLRQHLVELLFEEMEVPATFLARNAVTACFACGRTTGTVVDIGHLGTTVTPVHEGYVEARGILQSPMGGHVMDQAVLANLDALYKQVQNDNSAQVMPLYQVLAKGQGKRKSIFHELARLDMARACKEDGAGAAIAPMEGSTGQDGGVSGGTMVTGGSTGAAAYANAPKVSYELPDKTVVEISHPDRFKVTNLLFGLDEESVRARDDAVAAHADSLSSLLLSTTPTSSSESGDKSNTTATTSSTTASRSRLLRRSRATTTGIGKRGGGQRPLFSHDRLKQACLGYLQPVVQGAVGGSAPTTGGTTIAAAAPTVASAIPNMVCDAAFRCDRDQQALLLGNVVLAGGGSCVSPDVPLLLRNNVEQIIHTHTPGWRVKVLAPAIPERAVCSWLGGSIQASLGSFHEMYISKAEYEEWGCGIVNRKCP